MAAAAKAGMDYGQLRRDLPRIGEIPFGSDRNCMTTIHPGENQRVAYVKGAPEIILAGLAHLEGRSGYPLIRRREKGDHEGQRRNGQACPESTRWGLPVRTRADGGVYPGGSGEGPGLRRSDGNDRSAS